MNFLHMNPYLRIAIGLTVIALLAIFGCRNNNSDSQETLTEEEIISYQKKGSDLASSTQKVLASNLVGAIEEGGAKNALEFCNIEAIPLTDSMSVELGAHIKRVTDQPRNPANQANEAELSYIQSVKKSLNKGAEVDPMIHSTNGKVTGYYPIITNQLCMQCHGSESSQIDEATLTKMKELYPEDEATGYSVGELRGIWVVEMKKGSEE